MAIGWDGSSSPVQRSRKCRGGSWRAGLLLAALGCGDGNASKPGSTAMLPPDESGSAGSTGAGAGEPDADDDAVPAGMGAGRGGGLGAEPPLGVEGVPAYTPDRVDFDAGGVIYLLDGARRQVFRWDSSTERYLGSLQLHSLRASGGKALSMAVAASDDRLYIGYDDGSITWQRASGSPAGEHAFAQLDNPVTELMTMGSRLMASDTVEGQSHHQLFDSSGSLIASSTWNVGFDSVISPYRQAAAYDPALERYYFICREFDDALCFEQFEPETGALLRQVIVQDGEAAGAPIRPAVDGRRILVGTGDVYDADSMTLQFQLVDPIVDARWLPDGGLASISATDAGTLMERRDAFGTLVERATLPGSPLGIFPGAGGHVVLSAGPRPVLQLHRLSDDRDADGAPNTVDAFPDDPAAQSDSDHDGFPDAWNPGRSEADSTRGLSLDSHPLDPTCSSAPPDVVCDSTPAPLALEPDQIEVDASGVVYLLSVAQNRIFRWSLDTGRFMPPIVPRTLPWGGERRITRLAYLAGPDRFYFGDTTGAITQMDLTFEPPEQTQFAQVRAPLGSLLGLFGELLVRGDDELAFFESTGTRTRNQRVVEVGAPAYSNIFGLGRLYDFSGTGVSNIAAGPFIAPLPAAREGSGGEADISPPIRVSDDRRSMLVGNGDIYSLDSYLVALSLGAAVTDAQWHPDGGLVTLRPAGAGSLVEHRDVFGDLLESVELAGAPLRVLRVADAFIIVTNAGTLAFERFAPSAPGGLGG